jgi:CheY-like chemotaxis protein
MTEEQVSRLFMAFEQADAGTTRKFGGTGLGLAISKRIVEMMEGHISVDSEPGKGSKFTVELMLRRDLNEQARLLPDDVNRKNIRILAADASDDDFSGYNILLAEDVEVNREIVLALLEPTRLTIECAENGAQALAMFSETPEKYDMIFMDVQMPEMDGYEATRLIRASDNQKAKDIPSIAMTANVFREDVEKCLESGMNGHVGKPFDFEEVLNILRTYLH